MHRLRTKKSKGPKDEAENESSGGGLLSFKRGKNAPPPAKPVIDIAAALPSTDDFRTSLLMPNLAQRFSILAHEQSDSASQSSSKSGNNDALASFNFSHNFSGSGLPDIAETGSISGSITGKNGAGNACSRDSHTSDESTSIMNRSRPGEGNVLFGGRQKVYRVVASSARDSSEDSREPRSLGGRVYYDNDISDSTFARKEKKRSAAPARLTIIIAILPRLRTLLQRTLPDPQLLQRP
ncbi:hypothetical protein BDZ91DRAFT_169865 [Kalaharituber pfeilii]|nr:hypothetical protein BDZ91DRAFT_169865 [Kalaharituber pfeilii]